MNAEFSVIYVQTDAQLPEPKRRSRDANFQFAENVGASIVRLTGTSVPIATAEYVAKNRITQVLFGRSAVKGWKKYMYYLALQRFMNCAPDVDVHIVTQHT